MHSKWSLLSEEARCEETRSNRQPRSITRVWSMVMMMMTITRSTIMMLLMFLLLLMKKRSQSYAKIYAKGVQRCRY
jgi:hypothetical protein